MGHHMIYYNCKEVKAMKNIEKATKKVKELQKLVAQLEKLVIRIISIIGWIEILNHIINCSK
jgi:hypothetical protein